MMHVADVFHTRMPNNRAGVYAVDGCGVGGAWGEWHHHRSGTDRQHGHHKPFHRASPYRFVGPEWNGRTVPFYH
jgi:hypothetical protein